MSALDEIAKFSNAVFPQEACGLLLADGTVVECANVAEDPFNRFVVDPLAVAEWWETGTVVGMWHSHPRAPAVPSEDDEDLFDVPGWVYAIYSVVDEDLGWYEMRDGRLHLTKMESPAD